MAYTRIMIHKDNKIYVKTTSRKYEEKLIKLGFIELMNVSGFMNTVRFSTSIGAIWCGTARELFGKECRNVYRLILADNAGDAIK
jgi:hypothetical protein